MTHTITISELRAKSVRMTFGDEAVLGQPMTAALHLYNDTTHAVDLIEMSIDPADGSDAVRSFLIGRLVHRLPVSLEPGNVIAIPVVFTPCRAQFQAARLSLSIGTQRYVVQLNGTAIPPRRGEYYMVNVEPETEAERDTATSRRVTRIHGRRYGLIVSEDSATDLTGYVTVMLSTGRAPRIPISCRMHGRGGSAPTALLLPQFVTMPASTFTARTTLLLRQGDICLHPPRPIDFDHMLRDYLLGSGTASDSVANVVRRGDIVEISTTQGNSQLELVVSDTNINATYHLFAGLSISPNRGPVGGYTFSATQAELGMDVARLEAFDVRCADLNTFSKGRIVARRGRVKESVLQSKVDVRLSAYLDLDGGSV